MAINLLASMPKRIVNAKIACLDFSLQKTKMKLGVQVIITDPEKLDQIRQRESDITKERIQKILATGANVILTTGGIDDMCLKYFVEAGAMAVRRVLKRDLKRIAKASGGTTTARSQNACVNKQSLARWNTGAKQLQKHSQYYAR